MLKVKEADVAPTPNADGRHRRPEVDSRLPTALAKSKLKWKQKKLRLTLKRPLNVSNTD